MSQGRHVLDDYRPEKVVRSTPHTIVLRALDPPTSRRVVIKLVYPPSATVPESSRIAFLEAAEVARSGRLLGLPRVIDYGFTPDDQAFLVMDMVELAVPVSGLSDAPLRRRVAIAGRVVDAIDSLAASGGTHLNLRPDNLLVAVDESVLLTGYGTAAYRVGVAAGGWPEAGDRWLAPELMRPNSLRSADLGVADLYSLALVVCDLLGGELEGLGEEEPVVRLPEAGVQDRQGLEGALGAALRRDPARRSASLSDLRRLLLPQEAGAGGVEAGMIDLDPTAFETRAITRPLEPPPPPVKPEPTLAEQPDARIAPAPAPEAEEPAPHPAEVPPLPEPAPPAAPQAAPARPVVPRRRRRLPPWVLAAPAAALILVGVAGWLVVARALTNQRTAGRVAPSPVASSRPAPTPVGPAVPAVDPVLLEAERLMDLGDLTAVRTLLEGLDEGKVSELSGPEADLYQELMAAVGEADREKALRDLDGGLDAGSITMLRRAVNGLSGLSRDELAAGPELAAKLDRARRALAASERLREAEREGDPLLVIERAGEMIAVLPGYSRAHAVRDAAATTVEARVESAIAARDLASALAALRELERRWPERLGTAARIEWCEREMRVDAELQSVLAAAAAAGERGAPEEGLRLLAATTPNDGFAGRFAALREQLDRQLAAMDAGAPTITLADGFDPVIRKNETAVVPIEVRDDYRVERVSAWVGTAPASEFREIVLSSEGGGRYPLQVTPQMHGNDSVLFYVVAVDRSGHTTRLGSAQQPLSLERRGWLKRLTGSGR